jgi:hypothetical protein
MHPQSGRVGAPTEWLAHKRSGSSPPGSPAEVCISGGDRTALGRLRRQASPAEAALRLRCFCQKLASVGSICASCSGVFRTDARLRQEKPGKAGEM